MVHKEVVLQQATRQLIAIREKASYRLLERIRRLLGTIAPPGTLRGRIHAALLGGLAFFTDHGFVASFLRLVEVWKWAPKLLRGRSPGLTRERVSPADLAR